MKYFVLVLGLVAFMGEAGAQVRHEPQAWLGALEGRVLEPREYLDTAMALAGVAPGPRKTSLDQYFAWVDSLKGPWAGWDPEALGEAFLQELHKKYLHRYSTFQTRVEVVFSSGDFNCVSSAVLYLAGATALGLQVAGVETQDHAFCVVSTPKGPIDVETTQPMGWNPGQKHEFKDAFGKTTGFSYVPPGNYSQRKTISPKNLMGLLIQNIMAENLKQGRTGDNIGLAWDRMALEGSSLSSEVEKAYNNHGATLDSQRKYSEALEFLTVLRSKPQGAAQAQKLAVLLANNEMVLHLRSQDYTLARIRLDRWFAAGLLGASEAQGLRRELENSYLAQLASSAPWAEVQKALTQARQEALVEPLNLKKYTEAGINNQAARLFQRSGSRSAWDFLRALDPDLRQLPSVVQLLSTTEKNLAIDYHNKFAQSANRGDWDAARRHLKEGLDLLPKSSILLEDWKIAQNK